MDYTTAAAVRFGRIARYLVVREDEKNCHPQPNIDLCEKPASSDKSTPITIGVIVGIVVFGTLGVLTFFHLRRKRRDEKEWPKNNQELDDYGIVAPSSNIRPPQSAHHAPQQQQQQQQYNESYRNDEHNLEQSLRGGKTTGAFRHQDEQISADMKPVEPSDRI
ncbi:hypothetical protein F4808DRAFT_455400 [Astrocystis sublimbata]|nr:hypothetical protein F4808DRAFT_455400 [Astrocystis sublimbata]